jgi:signal transduction histidine kinase
VDGFDGVRVVWSVPWETVDELSFETIVEYQTRFSQALSTEDVVVLCQHDMRKVDDAELVDIIQIYPTFIYRGRVCENPFYSPPETCSSTSRPTLRADRILRTAYDLTSARDAIRRREQRVAVLNRVLRHNLRNEMNVIQGHTELIEAQCDDCEVQANVSKIQETTDRLLDVAEDARRIEQIAETTVAERTPVDLAGTVDRAADRAARHYPEIDVTRNFEPVWIEGREELELGLTELFKRMAEAAEGDCKIELERAPTRAGYARESMIVRCRNGTLPSSEVETVSNGIETPLRHSSGLGLWLVNWIVEHSGGNLTFRPANDGEETVVVTLPSSGDGQ